MNRTSEVQAPVLVVDDDPAMRLLARESLVLAGLAVQEAQTGFQALKALEELRPALVLLDVGLPDLDGFEVCARIRSTPEVRDTPVLMMTGLDDVASIRRAYEIGATDFVPKPPNWIILGHRVRYMIRAGQMALELRDNQEKLLEAQRIAGLGWWKWDVRADAMTCSEIFQRVFGLDPEAFGSTRGAFLQCIHPEDRDGVRNLIDGLLERGGEGELDHRIVHADGSVRHVHQKAQAVTDGSGDAAYVLGTIQDITERKNAEEKIRYLAHYDGLTGLPNGRFFRERLGLTLEAARRHKRLAAVLFLDLDRFKRVNDTLGHTAGDMLLREVGSRISASLRMTDCVSRPDSEEDAFVARLGGDEFIILLAEIQRVQDAARVAGRVLDGLNRPFEVDSRQLFVTGSVGIAVCPFDGEDADDLLKNADTAMYQAKEHGRNNFQFYNEAMNSTALERLTLETSLRGALERQELRLHFQPQVDVGSRKLIGVEALLRWQHPELGTVPPMKFIPLAEESGLILPIGEWALRAACEQKRAWARDGMAGIRIAVNVSGHQFADGKFVETVARVLEATGADPAQVEIELTESVVMKDTELTARSLRELKAIGVTLSVDDFGTGYSSLSYLKRLPLDVLKVDRSFLAGIPDDGDHVAIVNAIIGLGQSLKMRVIAEGVETERQADFLRARGCDGMQGYLLGRPMPPDEFLRWTALHAR